MAETKNGTTTELGLLRETGLVQTWGNSTGRLLDMDTLAKTIKDINTRRTDIVAPRKTFQAEGNGGLSFGFGSGKSYKPTTVALRQLAEKTKIPMDFLRENAVRYPGLAADIINTWWRDDSVANREGTARQRKTKVQAEELKHLFRLFEPPAALGAPKTYGVLRAILSNRYLIINNSDVLGFVVGLMERAGVKTDPSGSLTEERMYVRFKIKDMSATIQFKGKGKGHEAVRVPCGASLLLSNSDVGIGRLNLIPELEVFSCTNLMRTTEALAQIHVGQEYDEMGVLSAETVRSMTESLFMRIRDITETLLTAENFQGVAERFSEFAGAPVDNVSAVVENVTTKFSLGDDIGRKILDKYAEEGMANRFGLAQAITFQAHAVREDDFEKALVLEDVGSKILRMPEAQFRKELSVAR